MLNPHCLYKHPGRFDANGISYDTIIVDVGDVSAKVAEGWRLSICDAVALSKAAPEVPDDAPPTRAEMEAEAARRGLKVDGRWSDARLLKALS